MTTILLAGAGALGSQIALHLAFPERQFLIVDDDGVEEPNLWTTAYDSRHLGRSKAKSLAMLLARKRVWAIGLDITLTPESIAQTLQAYQNISLIVDTLDNFESRALLNEAGLPVVHVGVSEFLTGAITWGELELPESTTPRGQNPVCTRDLGRGILRLTAALAANAIEDFLGEGNPIANYVCTPFGVVRF